MKTNIHFLSHLPQIFLELNFSDKLCRETQVQTSRSMPFPENCAVYEIMWKNLVEPDATDKNMAHAHCMLYNQDCEHTQII